MFSKHPKDAEIAENTISREDDDFNVLMLQNIDELVKILREKENIKQ